MPIVEIEKVSVTPDAPATRQLAPNEIVTVSTNGQGLIVTQKTRWTEETLVAKEAMVQNEIPKGHVGMNTRDGKETYDFFLGK